MPPLSTCNVNILGPQIVRFVGANLHGWLGENTQLGTLTCQVSGGAGQTSLTIDRGSLEADDGLAQAISNVETKDGVVDIVGAVNRSDLNCSGVVTVADALVVLRYAGEGKYAGLLVALLRGTRSTAHCGATSTQTAWSTPATRSRYCSTQPTSPEAC